MAARGHDCFPFHRNYILIQERLNMKPVVRIEKKMGEVIREIVKTGLIHLKKIVAKNMANFGKGNTNRTYF